MKSAFRAVFAFFSLAFCSFVWSTDFYWVGKDSDSGNWSKKNNWSLTDGGTPGNGSYPQRKNNDNAIFTQSSEVTITTGADCGSIISSAGLNFQSSLTVDGDITISSGDLTVSDALSTGGKVEISSGNLSLGKGFSYSGDVNVSGDVSVKSSVTAAANIKANSIVFDGAVAVNADVSFTASSVNFNSTLNSGASGSEKNVVINGDAIFGGSVGESVPLNSLTVNGGNSIDSDKKILTKDFQLYKGEITTVNADFTSSNSSITFEKSLKFTGGWGRITISTSQGSFFKESFDGNPVLIVTGDAEIYGSNTFNGLQFSNKTSVATVKFESEKWQKIGSFYYTQNTILASTSTEKWYAVFDSTPSKDVFNNVVIKNSRSVKSSGSTELNPLGLTPDSSTITDFDLDNPTTEGWFRSLAVLGKLSFSLSLAPVGSNYIYLVSPEKILYGGKSLQELKNGGNLDEALDAIKSELKIMDKSASSERFEISEVEYKGGNENFTALLLTVGEKIALDDIPKSYLIFNGTEKHIISDFAVNAVKPLYACTKSSSSASGSSDSESDSDIGTFSIHDFGEDSGNSGKLPSGKDVVLQVSYAGENADDETSGLKLLASLKSSVKSSMKSDKINSLLGVSWRVWIPEDFEAVSSAANTEILAELSPESVSSSGSGGLWNFTFENEDSDSDSLGLKAGDEVQFVFRIGNTKIDHGDGTETYLYSYWIPEENILRKDFSVLDLWSFSLRNFTKQRGGVSILKNVINLNENEQSVIEVDMKSSGNLNVFIMTLDGNIVRRLAKGRREAGTHFFKWNGTNLSGKSVARGLYFVRVVGPEIDETRKIMCVKK